MSCQTCGQTEPNVTCVDCNPPAVPCAQAQPCTSVNSTDCTIYTGPDLGCHSSNPLATNGDTASAVLKAVVDYFCTHTHAQQDKYAGTQQLMATGDKIETVLINIIDHFQNLFSNIPSPSGATIVDQTHAQMVTMVSSGTLSKGQWYRITDFATMYEQPDYDNTNTATSTPTVITANVEPIIVFALSPTQLSPVAYQTAYLKDIVKYELQYTTPLTSTPTKGRIIERVDEFGNKTTYDHRTILFKRYMDATGVYSSTYDTGLGSLNSYTFFGSGDSNNEIAFDETSSSFDLPNIVFMQPAINNKILGNGYNATFISTANNNKFDTLIDSLFYKPIENNDISTSFDNIVNAAMYFNNIKNFEQNRITLTGGFVYNDFYMFLENTITTGSQFGYNSGKYHIKNTYTNCGNSSFNNIESLYWCTFTTFMINNTFKQISNTSFNSMNLCSGSLITACIFTGNLQHVNFIYPISAINFSTATHVYGDYTKKIYKNQGGNIMLSYYDVFDSEQTAAINS